ncbi:PREDICTED: probable phosphatase 2C [Prunus dulcis]|uniref:PREDICTED: probable phosphatase 2C n=1 Tax=Prunus dulcis TaxID=3755 RepID=A0A5E4FRN4_PRUDU|nr:PREDICTED: probable phosphatase 2C [Prunus dulcis]
MKVGSEILHMVKKKMGSGTDSRNRVGLSKSPSSEVPGEHKHPMEDYVVAETRKIGEQEIGLFAIFDGYECHEIPAYLQSHLFNNIMTEPDFFFSMTTAVIGAYLITDTFILEQSNSNHGFKDLSSSTAVTANSSEPPWPAEVGSS